MPTEPLPNMLQPPGHLVARGDQSNGHDGGPAADTAHGHDAHASASGVVQLSGRKFFAGCVVAAAGVLTLGQVTTIPSWVLAIEVFATILGLFVFGSIKYQIHKNAVTYGMGVVILSTFFAILGVEEAWHSLGHHVSLEHGIMGLFHGLDELIHLDTMLFILGLTFFVSVIAQTRLLEAMTFRILKLNRGWVLPTILGLTAAVSVASGVLDGVSMIGLTIRTLVILMVLAAAPTATIRYCVMVCTVVTTVCGMWLAYGEPPNLIMKANLSPPHTEAVFLTDGFFLKYCAPAALASFLCVAVSLRRKLRGLRVDMDKLDLLDAHVAAVRFLHASNYGEAITTTEFLHRNRDKLGSKYEGVLARRHQGEAMGEALVREQVPQDVRREILGAFVMPQLAEPLDKHYVAAVAGDEAEAARAAWRVGEVIGKTQGRRIWAQRIGAAALVPFVAMLILHALNHSVPLFLASFIGFAVAIIGILSLPRIRKLALHDARHEFSEYYFLIPLFLSISLLSKLDFFSSLQTLLHHGIEALGPGHVAWGQFAGATILSALLDNNVVADFASKALKGLPIAMMHLFALAQIAGYAAGGCWTHIGSAQSVVAYAFIQRDVDARFTPFQWIKAMTPLLLSIVVVLSIVIYVMSFLTAYLH